MAGVTKRGPSLGSDDKILDQFIPASVARTADIAALVAAAANAAPKGKQLQVLHWNGTRYAGPNGEVYETGYGKTEFGPGGPDPLTLIPALPDDTAWLKERTG